MLKIGKGRESGRVYTLMMLTFITCTAGIALFLVTFFSGRGQFDREYYSDIHTWNKERLAERMS